MKSAFITGANQGLGFGFVEELLQQGWQVFAGTQELQSTLLKRNNLTWILLELTDDSSIQRAAGQVSEHTSTLDLLVNNAGINKDTATDHHKERVSHLGDLERVSLRKMFDVNTIAPLMVLQYFLPLLTPDPSFVINVSSCRASFHDELENPYANYGYRASKIALNMFTFCSIRDVPKTVKTFAVHPGNIKTGMNPRGTDDPRIQAGRILAIPEKWNEEWNGRFMRYDGTVYPL